MSMKDDIEWVMMTTDRNERYKTYALFGTVGVILILISALM